MKPNKMKTEKYYHKGEQVKTIGAPYMLHGGEFIDAHDAAGKNITLATHAHHAANAERAKSEWREQQEQAARLNQ